MKYRMGCIAAVLIILALATVIMSPGSGLKTGGRAPGIAAYTYVNPSNVVSVTRMGGLPGNKFGVLLAGRDDARIEKIVGMVNRSTGMRAPTDMMSCQILEGIRSGPQQRRHAERGREQYTFRATTVGRVNYPESGGISCLIG